MTRFRLVLGVLAVAFVLAGWSLGDDKKTTTADDKKEPPRLKGQLPANWKKLGLTDEQTQKVYKIQGEYDAKIDALEAQIRKLKQDEKGDLMKVLTDAQKARLKEINEGK